MAPTSRSRIRTVFWNNTTDRIFWWMDFERKKPLPESVALVEVLNRAFQAVLSDQVLPDIVSDFLNVLDMVFMSGDGIYLYFCCAPAIAWTDNIKGDFLGHRPNAPCRISPNRMCPCFSDFLSAEIGPSVRRIWRENKTRFPSIPLYLKGFRVTDTRAGLSPSPARSPPDTWGEGGRGKSMVRTGYAGADGRKRHSLCGAGLSFMMQKDTWTSSTILPMVRAESCRTGRKNWELSCHPGIR